MCLRMSGIPTFLLTIVALALVIGVLDPPEIHAQQTPSDGPTLPFPPVPSARLPDPLFRHLSTNRFLQR
jgi:hypothetical protein